MTSGRLWVVVLALGWAVGSMPAAAADAPSVDQLIQQLGSGKFEERDEAARRLDALGAPALDALTRAANSPDMEVRRRAATLLKSIERRVEAEQILQPTRIQLSYRDRPLLEVIADLKKRTEYEIVLKPDPTQFEGRRVTIETPELSFWEALDQLCEKAGLVHQPQSKASSQRPQGSAVRMDNFGRPQPIAPVASVNENQIVLTEGKPSALATFYAGALRIRVNAINAPKNGGEATVTLEVAREPKIKWSGLANVLIQQALDERNQVLAQLAEDPPAINPGNADMMMMQGQVMIIQRGGGQFIVRGGQIWDSSGGTGWIGEDAGPVRQVRLKLPAGAGRSIKLFKGSVLARVMTPTQPLITVDEIDKAGSKTFKGKEGSELTVSKVTKRENGTVEVFVHLLAPANAIGGGVNAVIVHGQPIASESREFTLFDGQGKPYRQIIQNYTGAVNDRGAQELRLMFAPSQETTPKKLVYATARLTTIEVPFEVKDMPMP